MNLPITEGVSVIVPALNAEKHLPPFFKNLSALEILEVMVCDLGSKDATATVARQNGAGVFRAQKPAEAVRHAIEASRGNIVWLLPPGCYPRERHIAYLYGASDSDDIVAGYHPVEPRRKNLFSHALSYGINLQLELRKQVSPECAPFIIRYYYEKCGGFPDGSRPIRKLMNNAAQFGRVVTMPVSMPIDFSCRKRLGL